MSQACITFSDLTLGYNSHPAVHHLNGAVRAGSLTAVVGGNGSGKSTLMKGIVGLLRPMSGAVKVKAGTRLAYLPQLSELDRSFPARVVDLVSLGLWPRRGLFSRHNADDRKSVEDALSAVGLEGFGPRAIDTLSGGQLQRALFARVLVQDADLILLDEPFNAVDAKTVRDLVALIARWHGESRTVMVVVHDLDLVRHHFPEALLLARRPVAWGAARDTLSAQNLLRARQFQEAWSEDAPWCAPGEEHDHAHDHAHDHGHAHGNVTDALFASHPDRGEPAPHPYPDRGEPRVSPVLRTPVNGERETSTLRPATLSPHAGRDVRQDSEGQRDASHPDREGR